MNSYICFISFTFKDADIFIAGFIPPTGGQSIDPPSRHSSFDIEFVETLKFPNWLLGSESEQFELSLKELFRSGSIFIHFSFFMSKSLLFVTSLWRDWTWTNPWWCASRLWNILLSFTLLLFQVECGIFINTKGHSKGCLSSFYTSLYFQIPKTNFLFKNFLKIFGVNMSWSMKVFNQTEMILWNLTALRVVPSWLLRWSIGAIGIWPIRAEYFGRTKCGDLIGRSWRRRQMFSWVRSLLIGVIFVEVFSCIPLNITKIEYIGIQKVQLVDTWISL